MIELSEDYLTLSQAARLLPGRRQKGPGLNPATLWRWATAGRGPQKVKLRTVSLPGGLVTTRVWLEEFLTTVARSKERWESKRRTARQRRAESRWAMDVLRKAGVLDDGDS
jgi:hypothetical protein